METTDPWVKHQFEQETAALIEQRRTSVPRGCGWTDYEVRAVSGEGAFLDVASGALGFREERFGMEYPQAVSCEVCGGLFVEQLCFMRQHRLRCGWATT